MNKKDLKNEIKSAFKEHTPDLSTKIKTNCIYIEQLENEKEITNGLSKIKKISATLCFLILTFLFILLTNQNTNVVSNNYLLSIYLDVNPSIEIKLDENYNVYDCVPINDDASIVLENLNVNGLSWANAVNQIVSSMYLKGYLTKDANSILISVENGEQIKLDEIAKRINTIFGPNEEMKCSIIAQRFNPNDDLKNNAIKHHVSLGKMHLIEKIIKENSMYQDSNLDELSKMSIKELNLIYASIYKNSPPEKDFIFGKPDGFLEQKTALNVVLEHLEITKDDLKWYDVIALYHHDQMEMRKMIYLVTIERKDDNQKQKYIVDCVTGEILPDDTIHEWEDLGPGSTHNPPPKK